MKAPFPYFGAKSVIASRVWEALGQPVHYIEPFFGSGAVLLNRPEWTPTMVETVCDKDGFLANVWRALQQNPDEVARWCDWPVNHADLTARKARLIGNEERLLQNLIADETWFDAKLAGYWIWAASCWIGAGLTRPGQLPHVSDGGKGVHATGKRPHIAHGGTGVTDPYNTNIYAWFRELSERLRYVRVVCGDWTRVCGGSWQDKIGLCGVFFDPPYGESAGRNNDIYHHDSGSVAADVRKWCVARGDNPKMRIVLAGYAGEGHEALESLGWRVEAWSAPGGYGNQASRNNNRHKERLWYSPHCAHAAPDMFSEIASPVVHEQ